jgi:Ctr copper transporter family
MLMTIRIYQMLFTWNTENLCIVFPQWRVTGTLSLLFSLVAVALLTAGYELVRNLSSRYDLSSQEYANSLPRKCLPGRKHPVMSRSNEKTTWLPSLLGDSEPIFWFLTTVLILVQLKMPVMKVHGSAHGNG